MDHRFPPVKSTERFGQGNKTLTSLNFSLSKRKNLKPNFKLTFDPFQKMPTHTPVPTVWFVGNFIFNIQQKEALVFLLVRQQDN